MEFEIQLHFFIVVFEYFNLKINNYIEMLFLHWYFDKLHINYILKINEINLFLGLQFI